MANLPTSPAHALNWASAALTELCERVDLGENLNEAFLAVFRETKRDLAANTDNAVAFREVVNGMIDHAKKAEAAWKARKKLLENTLKTFDGEIKEAVEQNPDVPFQGALGSIKLAKNPPRIDYSCLLETKSVTNVITDEVIEMFEIDPAFVQEKIFKVLNTTQVKAALQNGEALPFATMVQEKRLAVRRA